MSDFKLKSVEGSGSYDDLVEKADVVQTQAAQTAQTDAAVETAAAQTQAAPSGFDFKGVFGDEFESADAVKARLEQLSKRPDIEVDEELSALIEAKKKGWTVDEYMRVTKTDYDSIDDAEVVKMKMRAAKPHLTAEEIDVLYLDEYGFDEESDDESLVARRKVKLKDAAFDARKGLNDAKAQYKPKGSQTLEVQERAKSEWKQGIENFNLDELVVKQGENEVIRYKVSPERVSELKKQLSEMDKYFAGYISEGKLDMNRLALDKAKALLFDDVVASAATISASKGREEVVERRNNVQVDRDSPAYKNEATQRDKALDTLRKAGFLK